MGLEIVNKHRIAITRDKVLRHHNIINSHQIYWLLDHHQEIDTTPK